MPIRRANAEWKGDLKSGKGSLNTETKTIKQHSLRRRFTI